jgi:hypothetical protein
LLSANIQQNHRLFSAWLQPLGCNLAAAVGQGLDPGGVEEATCRARPRACVA